MGLCVSCDAAILTADELSTAKVILPDGRLQEHCGGMSVMSSRILVHKDLSPPSAFFLCNADDLTADGRVEPLADYDELEPGQIYFVLPAHLLKRKLMPEEMNKMAVMAARAISDAGDVIAVGNPYDDLEDQTVKVMKKKRAAAGTRRRNQRRGCLKGRDFASNLTAIPE